MAENPKQTGNAQGDRQNDQERARPQSDETKGHERPMDDPGRGHGDKLEDEIPHGSGKPDQKR